MALNNLSYIFNYPEIGFGIQSIDPIIKRGNDYYLSQLNSIEIEHYNSLKLKK